jgi:hypothetical protein
LLNISRDGCGWGGVSWVCLIFAFERQQSSGNGHSAFWKIAYFHIDPIFCSGEFGCQVCFENLNSIKSDWVSDFFTQKKGIKPRKRILNLFNTFKNND